MKGIAFTFDAIFALIIAATIIPVFLLLSVDNTSEYVNKRLSLQAEDALDVVSRMRVMDVAKEQVIGDLYLSGALSEDDMNRTVLELVSSLWASNSTINATRAQNITQQIFGKIIPSNAKWGFSIDDEKLVDSGGGYASAATSSRRIVSGFRKGSPSAGYIASAFLASIGGKNAASYYFFGGFVGEGNISFFISDVPFDAVLKDIYMELGIGSNFTLYINENRCGTFNRTGFVDNFTINSAPCLNSIVPGSSNTFRFVFAESNLLKNYVGGGFLKISYTTNQLTQLQQNTTRFYLPGIEGIVNYFDSFYIKGDITAMKIHVNISSDHDVMLNIGNKTMFVAPPNTISHAIDVNNSEIAAMINYTDISLDTVPVRVAPTIVSFLPGGNASIDVVLVTDFSGSMKKSINNDSYQGNAAIDCNNLTAYPNARKTELAKCLDKMFVDIILNNTRNRLWPVYIFGNQIEFYDNPKNATAIKQSIDSYPQGKDQTCLSCAINLGYDILKNKTNASDPNRLKFLVLMTDGIPTHCALGSCKSNLSSYGTQYCQGFCDSQGMGQACVYEGCADNKCENPINNTLYATNRSKIDQRITIYTIGFGLVDACSRASVLLQDVASITDGAYYHSSNVTELELIYKNLASNLVNLTFYNQALSLTEGSSILYNNSYIDFNFTPVQAAPAYQEISVVQETPQFNACNYSLFLPSQVRLIDARVTSFSGDFWTMNVSINNSITGGKRDVFGLSKYAKRFESLGDPFVVQLPESLMVTNNTNFVSVLLGTSSTNVSSICSLNSRIIYTSGLRASVPFGNVFPQISGGVARIYYDIDHDGVQDGYNDITIGSSLPNFNPMVRTVDQLDSVNNALDDALLRLLDSLNHIVAQSNTGLSGASTNPIDVMLNNIDIDVTGVGGVPFAWGPLDVTLEVGI